MSATPHIHLCHDAACRIYARDTPIGRAGIRQYLGRRFAEWRSLGLLPKREYLILRHPDDIHLPAHESLPLLLGHPYHLRPRSVGEVFNLRMDGRWIIGDVDVTDLEAATMVRSGAARQLSVGWRDGWIDWTPGCIGKCQYDAVWRSPSLDHVALVQEGWAGSEAAIYV